MIGKTIPVKYVRRDGRRVFLVREGLKRNAHMSLYRCSECGQVFFAAKGNAKTCTPTCRKRRQRRMARELRAIELGQLCMELPCR